MAISSGDLTKLRYPYMRRCNTVLNIKELQVLATATIGSFSGGYPRTGYPVTGTSAGWENFSAGKLVRIKDPVTGAIKFEGITRIGNDANNVYIAAHAEGDTGLAQEFANIVAVGDDVEMYTVQPPITFQSILTSEGELLKRATRAFNVSTPQTANPRPQINLGPDQQFYTEDSTPVSVTLDASSSFSYVGGGLTYSWDLPTAATLTAGALTDASITVDLLPGNSRIKCVVTDDAISGTPSAQGSRWYYVNSATDNPAFSDEYAVEIGNFTVTRQGWSAQFTVSASEGDIPTSRLYTGAPVLFSYDIEYSADGNTWVTTDDETLNRRNFKGYLRRFDNIQYNRQGHIERVTFTVESLYLYADAMPIASQVVQYSASPTNWQESPYTDINRLFYLVTRYHNDVFNEDNDVTLYDDNVNYNTPLHAVNQGSIASALLEVVQKRLGCNLGSHTDGGFIMFPHRSYESDSWRSSQDIRMTLTSRDVIMDSFSYQLNEVMKYSQTNGAFFLSGTSGTPVVGIRGLGAPMQGVSVNQTQSFVAINKTDGLERIGHDHQYKNRRFDRVTARLINDGIIEPADMQAIDFDLDELDAMDKGILNNTTWIPIEMRYTFPRNGNNSVPPLIEVDFEPETRGEPAEELMPRTIYDTYTWDFTSSNGGFNVQASGTVYVASTGWQSGTNSTRELVSIRKVNTLATSMQTVTVNFTMDVSTVLVNNGYNWIQIWNNNSKQSEIDLPTEYPELFSTPFTSASVTFNSAGTDGDDIRTALNIAPASGGTITITSIVITYDGTLNFNGGA